ncbi:hypothetical protein [Thermococcus sp. JCM 11816]|uniref:hypothetical protein n=1 Tax=Thermococcus sp. (strain JCM 11816 / KS-1) TaxID=1295125 RepID=UPI0006D2B30A
MGLEPGPERREEEYTGGARGPPSLTLFRRGGGCEFEGGKHSLRLVAQKGGVVRIRMCEGDGHDL